MIAFFPSNAGKASSRWYVLSFNSAFLSSTTEGDIIRSFLPIELLLKALLQFFRTGRSFRRNYFWDSFRKQVCLWHPKHGRIQEFLAGGALVSCSTATPINHRVFFFWQNTSCIRKPQVISGGGGEVRTPCTLPLDPPLQKAAIIHSWLILYYLSKCSKKSLYWKLVPSLPAVCRVANWNSKEASPCAQRAGLVIRRSWVESLPGL